MEKQTGKIMRFSKVICIFLNIAIGIFIAISILTLAAWFITGTDLPSEIVMVNGVEMEVPYLFKIGNTKVLMPVTWKSGFDLSGIQALIPGTRNTVGIGDFLGVLFTIIALSFTKKVFRLLRDNGSPFREDIVKALKSLTIVLLVTGGVSGIIPFLAAGIVWVLCLIFDYGRALQNESDTTL
jgi:hypothetical protein